jgi:hypothetical protein
LDRSDAECGMHECVIAGHRSILLSQCSIYYGALHSSLIANGRETMKVTLASSSYRSSMLAMLPALPAKVGVGTVALWWRRLNRPLRIDAEGLTLRHHRRLPWSAISRIGVSRSYLDGHVFEMRIHHHGTVSKIPLRGLRDGEEIAGIILTMFKGKRRTRPNRDANEIAPIAAETRLAGPDQFANQVRWDDHPSMRQTHERVSQPLNSNGDCQ